MGNSQNRPSMLLIQKNPYAFGTFLVLWWAVAIAAGLMSHSLILSGLLLVFTIPFVLLATLVWAVFKAFLRMIFFEL